MNTNISNTISNKASMVQYFISIKGWAIFFLFYGIFIDNFDITDI